MLMYGICSSDIKGKWMTIWIGSCIEGGYYK